MSKIIEIHNLAAAIKKLQTKRAESAGQLCNTAVILHLYYPDLWDEIRGYLANLGADFDLYVSVCDPADNSMVERIKQCYPSAFVCKLENRGRDIGPFMEMNPVIAEHYRYLCKIHSKKSLTHAGGDSWRLDLFNKLLGSPERIAQIKALFDRAPEVGMVGAEGQLFSCKDYLYRNAEKVIELANRIGGNKPLDLDYSFPSGSMFWFKPEALTPLLGLNIKQASFELEQGQEDGTLAHAMERVFPLAVAAAGYKTVDTHILETMKELFDEKLSSPSIHLGKVKIGSDLLEVVIKCDKQLQKKDQQLQEKDRQLQAIYSSPSWRITAPLRWVRRIFAAGQKVH